MLYCIPFEQEFQFPWIKDHAVFLKSFGKKLLKSQGCNTHLIISSSQVNILMLIDI